MNQLQAQQRAGQLHRQIYNDMFGVGPWGQPLLQIPGQQEYVNNIDLLASDPQAFNRKAAEKAYRNTLAERANPNGGVNLGGAGRGDGRGPRTSFSVPGGGQGVPTLTGGGRPDAFGTFAGAGSFAPTQQSQSTRPTAKNKYPNPFA